jgi:hypothetical protein
MSSTALPAAVAARALVGKDFAGELRNGTVPKAHAAFAARVAAMCTADTQLPCEPERFLGEYTVFRAFVNEMLVDVLDSDLKLCAAVGTAHTGVAIAAHVVAELAKRVDRETDLQLLAATYQHLLVVRGFAGRDVSVYLREPALLAAGSCPFVASVRPPVVIGTPVRNVAGGATHHVLAVDADTVTVASATTAMRLPLDALYADWLFGWPSGITILDAAMYLLQVLLVHVARIQTNRELVHGTMAQLQTMATPGATLELPAAYRTLRWLCGTAPLIVDNVRVHPPWDHEIAPVGVDAEHVACGGSRFAGFGLATTRADWCVVRTPRQQLADELRANPETVDTVARWPGVLCVRYDAARRITCIGWWPGGTVLRPSTRLVADADVARAQVHYAIA